MKDLWKTKLAAWLHDPAEKALILLRDKEGHEWGTVRRLREELGISHTDVLKRADWYASAADRPQFPQEDSGRRFAAWTQVDFSKNPLLIHPLAGSQIKIEKLEDITTEHIKTVSEEHFRSLIVKDNDDRPDLHKTLLNYWRFGPEAPGRDLNHIWQNLPADTRIPDHSIWAHLDIVSAFAGAMAADGNGIPALLSVSFGPVQGFIAEARSTSDLWAGSHLLARIAWEGMKVVCERLGPDAVLFSNLRGVPLVDVWLRDEMGLPKELFQCEGWAKSKTDANPLFSAALPNRFVALIPSDQARDIAEKIQYRVREFANDKGKAAISKILQVVDQPDSSDLPCYRQLDDQLKDFPEVYWAAVPWSLAESDGNPDSNKLRAVLSNFYTEQDKIGFLDSDAWKVLQEDIELEGAKFYAPNPGVLYPAVFELLDRVSAAAKSARTFDQLEQKGYRSSMNGEREWLTLDRTQLGLTPGKRTDTLWTRLAEKNPSWAKKDEHLDALNTLKRLWPTIFAEWVGSVVGETVNRYVVSTHTLALAVSLERWLENPKDIPLKLRNLLESRQVERTALPRRLMTLIRSEDAELLCRKLPGVLDELKESDDPQDVDMLRTAEEDIKKLFGTKPEAYYGMILMDGDRMGAWLSGSTWKDEQGEEVDPRLIHQDCWHEQIRESDAVRRLAEKNPILRNYLDSKRWPSPARHRVISEALNHFSLRVAPFVVEDCFKGKLIYSGGDDVLAFVCVDDLLPAMALLRQLYSGAPIPEWLMSRLDNRSRNRFDSKNGYLRLDGKLLLTMGEKAQASCGAIVAHHQAPLGYVLRQLRAAESQAKNAGGRNAFSLRILKRGGGEIGVSDKWIRNNNDNNAPDLLDRLMAMFAHPHVSRRAAYHAVTWLKQLEPDPGVELLKANLAYQFAQQTRSEEQKEKNRTLAIEVAAYAAQHFDKSRHGGPTKVLENMLMTAEFLARETRREQDGEAL